MCLSEVLRHCNIFSSPQHKHPYRGIAAHLDDCWKVLYTQLKNLVVCSLEDKDMNVIPINFILIKLVAACVLNQCIYIHCAFFHSFIRVK